MLTRISKINNIRNYHNFECETEFSKKNVVYALNGSGKTNLSRFLRVFQEKNVTTQSFDKLKSLEAKDSNLSVDFELIFNKSVVVRSDNPVLPDGYKILVYNKDFLEENVSIQDFSLKEHNGNIQIGVIGANQAVIDKLKKDLEEEKAKGLEIKKELEMELIQRAEELQKSTRGKLSTFTEYLQYEKLNQGYVGRFLHIDELKASERKFVDLNNVNEGDRINALLKIVTPVDFSSLEKVLNQSFKFEDIEKEVENHISNITKAWIEIGINFHQKEGKQLCPFCRQPTTSVQVIKKYVEYVESLKAKTKSLIEGYKEKLNLIIETIQCNEQLINQGIGAKVRELIGLLGLKENTFSSVTNEENVIDQIQKLSVYLSRKEKDLELVFDSTESEEIGKIIVGLTVDIGVVNSVVKSRNEQINLINRKLVDAGARKSLLRKQMAQWAIIDFYINSKERRNRIEAIRERCAEIKLKLKEENDKSPQKDKKELIVRLLNKALAVAGIRKYQVDDDFHLIFNANKDDKFDITKETVLVSDGEKSVIAFAYYFASMLQDIDKFEDLDKVSLIVDDPISSTSYNYMHGIGSVLKNMSSLLKEVLESKRNEIPQIIILTHNLQFYNLLVTNIFKHDKNDKIPKSTYFSLFKKEGNPFLKRENNTQKLSEYMTALSRVYKFSKDELEENVGNDLRKVIETICSFHFMPLSHENLEKIFGKDIEPNLKLIADDYVHTDFNNFEDPLPFVSLREAANELLNLIEEKYPSQFAQILNN